MCLLLTNCELSICRGLLGRPSFLLRCAALIVLAGGSETPSGQMRRLFLYEIAVLNIAFYLAAIKQPMSLLSTLLKPKRYVVWHITGLFS